MIAKFQPTHRQSNNLFIVVFVLTKRPQKPEIPKPIVNMEISLTKMKRRTRWRIDVRWKTFYIHIDFFFQAASSACIQLPKLGNGFLSIGHILRGAFRRNISRYNSLPIKHKTQNSSTNFEIKYSILEICINYWNFNCLINNLRAVWIIRMGVLHWIGLGSIKRRPKNSTYKHCSLLRT